jgi:hypothetical protein
MFLLSIYSKSHRVFKLSVHSHCILELHVPVLRTASLLAGFIIGLGEDFSEFRLARCGYFCVPFDDLFTHPFTLITFRMSTTYVNSGG